MNTNQLLDAAKKAQGWSSDYRLCKALGMTSSRVGNWRSGRNTPDAEMVLRLAELAGIEPGAALAGIAAERATSDVVKKAWQKAARQIAGAVAVVIAAIAITSSPELSPLRLVAIDAEPTLYIMLNGLFVILVAAAIGAAWLRARRRRFLAWLGTTCPDCPDGFTPTGDPCPSCNGRHFLNLDAYTRRP